MTVRVIEVESGGAITAIHDNTTNQTWKPKTLPEAVTLASALIRAGHRVDLGLMQINYAVWLQGRALPVARVFDPCTNIQLGTKILQADYSRALRTQANPIDALWVALSRYNSGSDWRGLGYAEHVLIGSRRPVAESPRTASTAQLARRSPLEFRR
jgi:type IV secretion system protein VirB1